MATREGRTPRRAVAARPSGEAASSLPTASLTIDYLVLADFAQVVNRKLYLMGGGWDRFTPPVYPAAMRLGIAVGIRVPWLEANTPHHLTLVVRNEDDQAEAVRLEADFETGRPAGSRGEDQLVPFALNAQTTLPGPGAFVIVASIDNQERKRYPFKATESRG
jgi:hypothetical protein